MQKTNFRNSKPGRRRFSIQYAEMLVFANVPYQAGPLAGVQGVVTLPVIGWLDPWLSQRSTLEFQLTVSRVAEKPQASPSL